MAPRRFALIFLVAAGCSTHPLVDICDTLQPGHLYPNKVTPYGGVCIPQGVAIQGTAPSAPFGAVVPPPVPLSPAGPAVSVPTLPSGAIVPLPPTNLPPTFPPPR